MFQGRTNIAVIVFLSVLAFAFSAVADEVFSYTQPYNYNHEFSYYTYMFEGSQFSGDTNTTNGEYTEIWYVNPDILNHTEKTIVTMPFISSQKLYLKDLGITGGLSNYGKTPIYVYMTIEDVSIPEGIRSETVVLAGFVMPGQDSDFEHMVTDEGKTALFVAMNSILSGSKISAKIHFSCGTALNMKFGGVTFRSLVTYPR